MGILFPLIPCGVLGFFFFVKSDYVLHFLSLFYCFKCLLPSFKEDLQSSSQDEQ